MPTVTLTIPQPAPRRLPELDELKGLAILLVILYHAGGTLVWRNGLHGDLGVDMFVIISGIGLSLGRPWAGAGDFFRRRLVRILPAYWIALSAYWALNAHFLLKVYSPKEIVLHYLGIHAFFGDVYAMGINDSFWFVTLILTLYTIYAALRTWVNQPDRLILAGSIISVSMAVVYFYAGQAGVFSHFAVRLPGFFLGLLVGRLLRDGQLALPLTGQLGLGLFVLTYVPFTQGFVFNTVVIAVAVMLAYVYALRPALPAGARQRTGGVLAFFGRYSLEIFLIHQPLIRDYPYYCLGRFLGIPAPSPIQLMGAMAVGLALTLVLSVELQRLLNRFLPSPSAPAQP